MLTSSSARALPRGRQQVNEEAAEFDPLYSLMLMCKEAEGKNPQEAFVRLVNAAPYPMMLLAYDWMLDDLVRFCTSANEFSVFGIDPTFSLGAFDVTVTTYHHLLLHKRGDRTKSPTMIGPLFIHLKKDFATYHFFASSLVSRRVQLTDMRCFGTYGEEALWSALSTVFPRAIQLWCFLHFRGNLEHKLHELSTRCNSKLKPNVHMCFNIRWR